MDRRLWARLASSLAKWAARAARVVLSVMAVSSYLGYSTAGFDFEGDSASGFSVAYYRIRWDHGSTWVGRAVQSVPRPDRPFDWFDPGGTAFDRPSPIDKPTWWNRRGFWLIAWPTDDPFEPSRYPGAIDSRWVAAPSWLVLLAVWPRLTARAGRRAVASLMSIVRRCFAAGRERSC